jgi:plasmid stabilization system protein ParE
MAKSEIVWTDEARRWLRVVREYIARDSLNAADRTIDGIWQKAQLLANFPEAGFKYHLPGRDDVRVLMYGHYRIAYVLEAADKILILGVFHSSLDIDRYFPDEHS